MDEHFRTAPLERNLPVLLGLLGVWYTNFLGAQTVAVLPYDQYLKRFPAYLQQLTMESNGKRVRPGRHAGGLRHRRRLWGEPGTNGQHAFYQLIHQGTRLIPVRLHRLRHDPQPARRAPRPADGQLFAQAEALAFGKTAEEVRAEGVAPTRWCRTGPSTGNRPSNTILLLDELTPRRWAAGRALRAQGLHAGRDLGHQLLRPVGRGAGQGAGAARSSPSSGRRRARRSRTTARPTR